VVVVEDGPTLTHGGMSYGAGTVAARAAGAAAIVDPRPAAAPGIRAVLERYPHIGRVLPALGYGPEQLDALRRTLDAVDADVVVAGTPVDLGALVRLRLPVVRARYAFAEVEEPGLGACLDRFLEHRFGGREP
jgi:predicted GTPase